MRRSSGARRATQLPASHPTGGREQEKMDAIFAIYADQGEGELTIGPEGVERFCTDLGMEPTDIRILLLAWKMQASRMGYFSLEEWRRGFRALRADSLDKLKKAIPSVQQEITHPSNYRDLFRFAFQYCLTEPRQKTLDIDTACIMLQLVAPGRRHQDLFAQYLQEQNEYKAINLDQWLAFLRFSEEVDDNMGNYDENMAWPLLMDGFVEWAKHRGREGRDLPG